MASFHPGLPLSLRARADRANFSARIFLQSSAPPPRALTTAWWNPDHARSFWSDKREMLIVLIGAPWDAKQQFWNTRSGPMTGVAHSPLEEQINSFACIGAHMYACFCLLSQGGNNVCSFISLKPFIGHSLKYLKIQNFNPRELLGDMIWLFFSKLFIFMLYI